MDRSIPNPTKPLDNNPWDEFDRLTKSTYRDDQPITFTQRRFERYGLIFSKPILRRIIAGVKLDTSSS